MQDIVNKIFPRKRNITNPPEIMVPSSPLNAKRKERSLSSLVVGTPKVSVATNLTGRRAKALKLSAAKGGSPCSIEEPKRKEEEPIDNGGQSSSSEALNKFANQRQAKEISTTSVPLDHRSHGRARETETEPWGRKAEMWTPLNCLLEVATGTKPSNFDYKDVSNPKPQPSDFSNKEYLTSRNKAKPEKVDEGESYLFGTKGRDNGHIVMMEDDENARTLLPGEVRSRRIQAMKRKQAAAAGKLVAPQCFLNTMKDKQDRRNKQIWLSLVASQDQ